MCSNCFITHIYSFDSYTDFDIFEQELQAKCNSKQLTIIDRHETDYLSAFSSYLYYRCNTCGELWVKSIPDYAWRGFFLPETDALAYIQKIRKNDKQRSWGCLILIAVIIIVVVAIFFT